MLRTILVLAITSLASCDPPLVVCDQQDGPKPEPYYMPRECSSQSDCERGEHCADTRTCSHLCRSDAMCAEFGSELECGEQQAYCIVACDVDVDCPDTQTCGPDGACWFEP